MTMSFRRIKAFFDTSAWLLILPAVLALFWIDEAMARTLVQWVIFAPVLAGVAIVISLLVFPQINLTEAVRKALDEKNGAAAAIAVAIVSFVAVIFLALVLWTRV